MSIVKKIQAYVRSGYPHHYLEKGKGRSKYRKEVADRARRVKKYVNHPYIKHPSQFS